jgi:hypothetical protein
LQWLAILLPILKFGGAGGVAPNQKNTPLYMVLSILNKTDFLLAI